jgi:hypothetical protein
MSALETSRHEAQQKRNILTKNVVLDFSQNFFWKKIVSVWVAYVFDKYGLNSPNIYPVDFVLNN